MALKIEADAGYALMDATRDVRDALQYLRRSKLASEIIEDIESSNTLITIKVGPGLNDRFEHPPLDTGTSFGGVVYWDPGFTLGVTDKANKRPNVPWVKQIKEKRTIWNCCGQRAPTNQDGEINPKVCLMHELGHVLQYLSNPAEFRALFRNADGSKRRDGEIMSAKNTIEQVNTAAIEQPIIMELRDSGCNLGIRWDYYHTSN